VDSKGQQQIEDDLFTEMEDMLFDEDAFDLTAARGGFEVEIAGMVEFLEESRLDWWDRLDEWVWISFDDATETWIGVEYGALTLGPENDHDALELFRIAKELEQYR